MVARPAVPHEEGIHTERKGEMLVIFLLDGRPFALPLVYVEKVVRAVAVTPVAGAPVNVLGVIDLAGTVVPVFDFRRCLDLPFRAISLSDQMLIVTTGKGSAALLVDSVEDVVSREISVPAAGVSVKVGSVAEFVTVEEGLVLVHDPERLLWRDDAEDSAARDGTRP